MADITPDASMTLDGMQRGAPGRVLDGVALARLDATNPRSPRGVLDGVALARLDATIGVASGACSTAQPSRGSTRRSA
jgi:hypothetical protein